MRQSPRPSRRHARPALTLLLLSSTAFGTDYIVDSTGSGTAADGLVTLEEALAAASGNVAVGDAPAGEEDGDTITFDPALAGQVISVAGELVVTDDVTIQGRLIDFVSDNPVVLDGGDANRIFSIDLSGAPGTESAVTLRYFALQNGRTTDSGGAIRVENAELIFSDARVDRSVATGAAADQGGGGLYLTAATALVRNVEFDRNRAIGASGSGGAILANDAALDIVGSRFEDNESRRAGGAVEVRGDSSVTMSNVSFSGNDAGANPGNGGGVHISGDADVDINVVAAFGNVATEGGAFWNGSGTLSIAGAVAVQNVATGSAASNGGGAIFNAGGTVNVTASTFDTNVAAGTSGSGGAILNDGGIVAVTGGTLRRNFANRAGGAVETRDGAVSLMDVDVSDNDAGTNPGNGGALHITGAGSAGITGGSYRGNIAGAEGGALWNSATGQLIVNGATLRENTAGGDATDQGGGGIFNDGGETALTSVDLSENQATGAAGSGGGLFNNGGTVDITDSSIADNTASRAGGGIEENASGAPTSLILTNTMVNGNDAGSAPGNGGGIHVTGPGAVTMVGGGLENNTAVEGGALWSGGAVSVEGARIRGNAASVAGGGLYQTGMDGSQEVTDTELSGNQAPTGGGWFSEGGNVDAQNVTLSGNEATVGDGGGMLVGAGTATLRDVTVADNTAAGSGGGLSSAVAISAGNSIFADNSGATAPEVDGTLDSQGFLLLEDPAGATISGSMTGVVTGVDPDLDRLSDNGGDTFTHALLDNSAAIDAGDDASCPATDQRGAPRDDGACDMGAYEAGAGAPFLRDLIFANGFGAD